jgi:hypothetical protein
MPAAIETHVKTNVINQWLAGDGRDRIAADNQYPILSLNGKKESRIQIMIL